MTSTHQEDIEPRVKKERLDEMDEMLNYEMPMIIDIPGDGDEVDPLMPIDPLMPVNPTPPEQFIKSEGDSLSVAESDGVSSCMPITIDLPVIKQEQDLPGTPDCFCQDSSSQGTKTEIKSEDDPSTISNVEECEVQEEFTSKELPGQESIDLDVQQVEEQTSGLASRLVSSEIGQISSTVSLSNQPSLRKMPALIPIRSAGAPSTRPSLAPEVSTPVTSVAAVTATGTVPVAPNLSPKPVPSLGSLPPPSPVRSPKPTPAAVQPLHQATKTQPLLSPKSSSSVTVQTELPDRVATVAPSATPPVLQSLKVRLKKPASVSQILKNPFTSGHWTKEQQLAILTVPRPTPNVESPTGTSPKSYYENNPWLCGCTKLKTFFCWPCLLFLYHSPESMVWCVPSTALSASDIFAKTLQAHKDTEQHRQAQKKLSSWLEENTPPEPSKGKSRYRNLQIIEKVCRNRKLLSLLLQSICHLKKGSHESQIAYYQCFAHVVRSSKALQDTLESLQGSTSPKPIAAFISSYSKPLEESVKIFIRNKIADELKTTRFVTLFFEDFSSTVDLSTVAVIAHFIDRSGKIQQRVIELLEIDEDRSAGKVYEMVQILITKHALSLKLVGYTYSPTLVHPAETADFNDKIEAFCPKSRFFHYQNHDVAGMLFAALSHLNKKCNNFFGTIIALRDFFNKHLVSCFRHFELTKSIPSNFDNFDYYFITTLRICYATVMQTLVRVMEDPADWDGEVVTQVPIFLAFLQDTTNCFLIVLISQLCLLVWDLTKALKGEINTTHWKALVHRTLLNFRHVLRHGFKDMYAAAVSPNLNKDKVKTTPEDPPHLVDLFEEVIHTGMTFLKLRFSSVDCGLVPGVRLQPVPNPDPSKELKRNDYFSRLSSTPDEMEIMRIETCAVRESPLLRNKTLAATLKCFYDFNMAKVLPCYAKFLDLAMTIPSLHTMLHCPAVERIQASRLSPTPQPIPQETVWMEKELLAEIVYSNKICEAVLDIVTSTDEPNAFSYGKEARAYLGVR